MRDSEIEQWVLKELGRQRNGHRNRNKEICVCATDGIVTLNGTVRTRYEKSNAQKAALRAQAVTEVINNLKVLPPEPPIKVRAVAAASKISLTINQYQRHPTAPSVVGRPRA